MKYSYDDGKTWSYAERIPKGNLGPIRAKPIELENGDLLCPSSWEYSHGNWKAHMEVYQPKTNFWKKIAIDPNTEFDVIQPTILQYGDSKMQILCRSQQNKIVEAWSEDNGKTWGKLKATNLPNPSAGVDAVTLPDGNQLLIYNPTEKSRNSRAKLNLAISKDGVNWEDIYKLENEAKGEFSYPAMIVDKNGQIQITYTWNREKIKHVVLKLKS
jgi:alpha-L-fucosidase